jgi:toxin ParE1/3/4
MGQLVGPHEGAPGSKTLGAMTILWSPEAIEDLTSLRTHIADDNPAAARGVVLHIMHNIEQLLSDNPQMGRPGRVPGTRELVVPRTPFIVPYRLQRNIIQILRVYHGTRRWPESF